PGESDHVQLSCISLRGRVHQNQLQGAIPLLAATVRRVAERIAED
ncbi:IclR family transcriptional regulator, partial [Rhodococcus hoagii]|nr:IclR family transcriptional regulator [Prescottella equi]